MNYIRLLLCAGFGFAITAVLFVIMPTLIEMADKGLDDKKAVKLSDISMPDTKITENLKDVKPEKPDDPEEPPPELEPQETEEFEVDPNAVNMSPEGVGAMDIGLGAGISIADSEYLPIVKVAPIYPRRANSRGIEGTCLVEFTVTKNGSVKDPVALECQPKGYFERASTKAALKFKYQPKVVDGEPQEVRGVQNLFTYELED